MTDSGIPPGVSGMTVDQALDVLRRAWEGEYVITYDEILSDRWRAWRLDRIGHVVGAATPGDLDVAIRADHTPPPLRPVPAADDNVARWEQLRFQYPQASCAFSEGWYYGSLRDDDDVIRVGDLGRLIDLLLAREEGPFRAG